MKTLEIIFYLFTLLAYLFALIADITLVNLFTKTIIKLMSAFGFIFCCYKLYLLIKY